MSFRMIGLSTLSMIALLLHPCAVQAQVPLPSEEQAKEMKKVGAMLAELQRLTTSTKLAEELELTDDQKRRLLIATQKFTDAMMKTRQTNPGKFDMEGFKKQSDALMLEAEKVLNDKQSKKLSELAKAREKKQQASIPTQDQMKEMQRLSSMMSELQRLSFDPHLAEKLGLTVEQRVQIREASQKFNMAMQEMSRANDGQSFDMSRYTQMIGDLMIDAQDILTPEQSEKLSRTAKLKQLKQRFGDEFAMVNGLAEDFDLDPRETKRLQEEIEEAREDYYRRLAELKEDTLGRILRELPRDRREQVRESVEGFFDDDDPRKKRGLGTSIRIGG